MAPAGRLQLGLVAAGLGWLCAGHQCSNGQRVACTAVQSTRGAPPSFGYSATGFPLCTPEGKKVMCLVDHSYHRCPEGQVPCCQDGSNPIHHHRGGVSSPANDDDVMCIPEGADQIVLDNMDMNVRTEAHNTYEGSYAPCLQDAYKEQFHHDWAKNKGDAYFSFSFDPPKSGCYAVEEHHPGSDPLCARYLPRNAHLEVNYCKGKSATMAVNQAENGGQWNALGAFMFYQGMEGNFTMRNSPEEQCGLRPCFLVADAFRLTWLGEDCSDVSGASVRKGTLAFRARLNEDGTADDLWAVLDAHHRVFEVALTAHLGYKEIKVLEVVTVVGRRLPELANDPARGAQLADVEVRFLVRGPRTSITHRDLTERLQEGLAEAKAGVEVEDAAVVWTAALRAQGDDGGSRASNCSGQGEGGLKDWVLAALIAGPCAGLALCAVCTWRICKKRRNKNEKAAEAEKGQTVTEEHGTAPAAGKAQEDLEAASASTGAPDGASEADDGSQHSSPGRQDQATDGEAVPATGGPAQTHDDSAASAL
mmetsp:Transcript_87915/g.243938  ORF Transcript_87915/g.243938 Transcript_87915/m.243938 type:complete len:534 (-) Transcript_87915:97-1698(-)